MLSFSYTAQCSDLLNLIAFAKVMLSFGKVVRFKMLAFQAEKST